MSLRADTVNRDALRNPLINVSNHAGGDLCIVGNVEVIVVDVELGVGVSSAGGAERNADKVLTEDAAEDTITETTVLGEDLVDDIPLQDLALVVGDDGGDVVLDDLGQGVAVIDLGHPVGQLAVPEEGVATHELAVLEGEVDDLVGVGEVERTAARCGDVSCQRMLICWKEQ